MHVITMKEIGGPEVLSVIQSPQVIPGPDQLLIHVKAAGLNRADLLQRRGRYDPPPGESDILGMEIAGQVVGMGANVDGFGIGEKVFGLVGSGGYAEYCLLNQGLAMPIPEKLSYVEAAGIAEAFLTAQEAVCTLGQLHKSEAILIHAGGSGVGSAALQLAHLIGATLFTTTSSPEKYERIKEFGNPTIINYKEQDFATEIMRLTDNRGVNVIIDFIGARYLAQHLQILQTSGRLSMVGMMGGNEATINLESILRKRLQIKGLMMRNRPIAEKRFITQQFKKTWLPFFETGLLKPIIDRVFPFAEAAAAHAYMESNKNVGKIILSME
jgi:putative PIG3 family NAD(P)H quinone oxidoreductase